MADESLRPPMSLNLCHRSLELVMAVDRIRDSAHTPDVMLADIVNLMAERFHADLCLLYLISYETGESELRVVKAGETPWWTALDRLGELARQALERGKDTPEGELIWQASAVLGGEVAGTLPSTAQIVAIPIILNSDHPLGVLLMARIHQPFDDEDRRLLAVAESQIDSAVVQAHVAHELAQRNKELETLYRVDRIRDQNLPFDEMLSRVLRELREAIHAHMGFVMLYNRRGGRLEMRALTHDELVDEATYFDLVNRVAYEAVHRAEPICYHMEDAPHCALVCVPLILRGEILGVLGALNPPGYPGFTRDDQRLLHAIVSQMDTAIFESIERRRLRRVLGRSVDPHVLETLLASPSVDMLEGERRLLTVLYADLRGSTALAERLAPELLVAFINDYLGQMTEVVLAHGGTLDKFVGDEVMALFGAPLPQEDHALRAVRVGLAMQAHHHRVVEQWRARGVETAGLGIGIATGELIVGEIGCEKRTDYTVIGPAANLGARICATAKAGQVLISPETYALVREQVEVEPVPNQHFKGISHPVTVYSVIRLLQPD